MRSNEARLEALEKSKLHAPKPLSLFYSGSPSFSNDEWNEVYAAAVSADVEAVTEILRGKGVENPEKHAAGFGKDLTAFMEWFDDNY